MMPTRYNLPLIIRHLCLWSVILFGLVTIMATGGKIDEDDEEEDEEPTPITYRKTMEEIDSDFNGVVDSIYVYSYDIEGNLNTRTHYTGRDTTGTPDEIITYLYDSSGRKLKEMRDTNGDSIVDGVSNYSYDTNGNLSRIEDDNDNNPATAINSVTEVTWDEI